ncbi:hypothetical protein, partial [Pseudomonas sp. HMWF011]|uniref:hypothetical protein n=1 Tax=Pseudomonas sp. HMWF011 TaxID=2056848 RepID=UPI001C487031
MGLAPLVIFLAGEDQTSALWWRSLSPIFRPGAMISQFSIYYLNYKNCLLSSDAMPESRRDIHP